MKALVTGGAGFIGSHLAEALWKKGYRVVVLDNLSTGKPSNLDWSVGKIEFVRGDVRDLGLVARLVEGCDVVFHEAAVASVPRSVDDPLNTNDHNLNGTLTILEAARSARVRRVVFASSSAVYGHGIPPSQREEHPLDPLSPYALQKATGEQYCRMFWRLYGLETVALRYFNIFGPRQSFDSPYAGVIAKFCVAFLEGKQPTIFGDGHQTRDFTYVSNAVHANLLAAEAPAERVAGRVFNIGSARATSILDLWQALSELTGFHPEPKFGPERQGEVRNSVANLETAECLLGYKVQVGLEEGLRRTLEFYKTAAVKG
ncbi:MAG: SDR family oxidoreductase [Verrucomicrobiae bacterium]|nr:SDR family oxidoreductase [Verrucomicrobiae bacterium]